MKHYNWTPSLIGSDIQVSSDVIARQVFGLRARDYFFSSQAGTNITITRNALGSIINSSGGGGGTFGTVIADFGTGSPTPSSVTVAIVDAGVGAASNIVLSINPGTGRDLDEMELGPVIVSSGDIVAGVGFNVIAVSVDETAHGTYNVQYTRN